MKVIFWSYSIFLLYSLCILPVSSWTLWDPPVGCTVFPLIKAPLCSGHGHCMMMEGNRTIITEANIPNTQCICDPGWSGINDFVNMSTHDCGQSIVVLQIFYAFIMLAAIRELVFILLKLYSCYQVYLEEKEAEIQDHEKENTTTSSVSGHHSKSQPRISAPTPPLLTTPSFSALQHLHSSPSEKKNNKNNLASSRSFTPPPLELSPLHLSPSAATVQKPTTTSSPRTSITSPPSSSRSSTWRVMLKWPVVKSCLIALISGLTIFIFTLLRLIGPRSFVIGTSVVGSTCLLVWDLFFLMAERGISFSWLKVRGKLVRFTAKHKEHAKRTVLRLKRMLYVAYGLDATRMVAIIMIHVYPQHASKFSCYFHTCVVISLIISSVACIQAGQALEKILMDGMDMLTGVAKEERERALLMIRRVVKEMKRTVFVPGTLAFMAGWWPFLRSHLSYFCINVIITTFVLTSHLGGMQPPRKHVLKKSNPVPPYSTSLHLVEKEEKSQDSSPLSGSTTASPSTTPYHTPMLKSIMNRSRPPTPLSKPEERGGSFEEEEGEKKEEEEKLMLEESQYGTIIREISTGTPQTPERSLVVPERSTHVPEISYSRRVHSHHTLHLSSSSSQVGGELDLSSRRLNTHLEEDEYNDEDEEKLGAPHRKPTIEELFQPASTDNLREEDPPSNLGGVARREGERGVEDGRGLDDSLSHSALDSSTQPMLFSQNSIQKESSPISEPSTAAPVLNCSLHGDENADLLPIFNPFQ